MADDFDPFASSSPTESDVDAAYDRYIKNLEKSVSDLSDDEVMKDVLDSFFASKGEDPQSLFLPTPENRLKLYKTSLIPSRRLIFVLWMKSLRIPAGLTGVSWLNRCMTHR